MKVDPKVLTAFDLMIAGMEGVERRGATMPYVSLNGNMYAMINKANVIGLRLGEGDLKAFEAVGGQPFEAVVGIPVKGYVAVPTGMFRDRLQLQTWFRRAHAFAQSLPAKDARTP